MKKYVSIQDILNAVFDRESETLRVSLGNSGGLQPDGTKDSDAFQWLEENLDALKWQLGDLVHASELRVTTQNAAAVSIDSAGNVREIADADNLDGDAETLYRLEVPGYALDIEAYASQDSDTPDRCYTKMVYDAAAKKTRIYLEQAEFEKYSSMSDGKDILRIYCLDR